MSEIPTHNFEQLPVAPKTALDVTNATQAGLNVLKLAIAPAATIGIMLYGFRKIYNGILGTK